MALYGAHQALVAVGVKSKPSFCDKIENISGNAFIGGDDVALYADQLAAYCRWSRCEIWHQARCLQELGNNGSIVSSHISYYQCVQNSEYRKHATLDSCLDSVPGLLGASDITSAHPVLGVPPAPKKPVIQTLDDPKMFANDMRMQVAREREQREKQAAARFERFNAKWDGFTEEVVIPFEKKHGRLTGPFGGKRPPDF